MVQPMIDLSRSSELHPTGGNSLLIAQHKSGKTTLGNNLLRSLADRVPFLGFRVRELAGRVAMWNYEVIAAQERQWLRVLGISDEGQERASICHLRGHRVPFGSKAAREWSIRWLGERQVEFWIIDPFARAYGGDENNNTEVGRWCEWVDEIKRKAGVVDCLVSTHTGWSSDDRSRGAARLSDWADSAVEFFHKEDLAGKPG